MRKSTRHQAPPRNWQVFWRTEESAHTCKLRPRRKQVWKSLGVQEPDCTEVHMHRQETSRNGSESLVWILKPMAKKAEVSILKKIQTVCLLILFKSLNAYALAVLKD